MTQPLQPKELPASAQPVWQGNIFTVWQWEQELFDGTTQTFEAITRPDAVFTIGVLPDQKILLVEDEQPHRPKVLTPSGGRMEAGEEPAAAAQREFLEETGYEVTELIPWYTYQPGSKVLSTVHLFIGRDLVKRAEPEWDAGERIQLRVFTFDEFLQLGQDDYLRETSVRLRLLEAQLDPAKRDKLHHLLFT